MDFVVVLLFALVLVKFGLMVLGCLIVLSYFSF